LPVLCWMPPLPQWTGRFGEWAADVPYLGWLMMVATFALLLAPAFRSGCNAVRSPKGSV
jgi:hypothetical protein